MAVSGLIDHTDKPHFGWQTARFASFMGCKWQLPCSASHELLWSNSRWQSAKQLVPQKRFPTTANPKSKCHGALRQPPRCLGTAWQLPEAHRIVPGPHQCHRCDTASTCVLYQALSCMPPHALVHCKPRLSMFVTTDMLGMKARVQVICTQLVTVKLPARVASHALSTVTSLF